MRILARLGRFEATEGDKHWIVGDISVDDSETFLTGVIGFTDEDTRLHFDEDSNSWVKAVSESIEGASTRAVVPFAIDIRSDRRWTANATSTRVRSETFRKGIELALNAARAIRGWSTDWEVDAVSATRDALSWLNEHPNPHRLSRIIKLPNPGRDLTDDYREMRALEAQRKHETFDSGRGPSLHLVDQYGAITEEAEGLFSGVEEGRIEIHMEATRDGLTYRFRSTNSVEDTFVSDFGEDLELGIELILGALRSYSMRRAS